MRDAFDVNASDIHLTVGLPPMFRVNGVLRQAGEELLRREDTYNMAMELMDDRRRTQFLDNGEADFSYEIENVCRFRVNVFKQSNCVAAALRSALQGMGASALPPQTPEVFRPDRQSDQSDHFGARGHAFW